MPAEVVEQAAPPKASELPYMEVPPIEERMQIDEPIGTVKEKETRYCSFSTTYSFPRSSHDCPPLSPSSWTQWTGGHSGH